MPTYFGSKRHYHRKILPDSQNLKGERLIVYDELNLSEIAYKMHYSSVAHLSNQFKKYTGLTPTPFKKLKNERRDTLEDV